MEAAQAPDTKKIYIVMFTSWISYIAQIIFILSFTIADIKYYKEVLLLDLLLFLISCGICIFVTYSISKNNSKYYKVSIILTVLYDIIVILSIYNLTYYLTSLYKGKTIVSIIIKVLEIFPGVIIFINYKLINGPNLPHNRNNRNNNNNNNNNNINNNNNNLNNNLII